MPHQLTVWDRIREEALLPSLLFLLTVATRIPFTSKFLYHMDSGHFALALRKYDLTLHQPHPPGYFLYVMLGRLLNIFIADANMVFISISIFFSGLTVVTLYYLGRELFDEKTGAVAAALAIASPNLWFHGEVALSYSVEAFFSTLTAFLCLKLLEGKGEFAWLSALSLGLAGGIRQNTVVFLFPLWTFSLLGLPARRIIGAIAVFAAICLCWFVPMIMMTGGWNNYQDAFRELWLFNTGNESVFENGWDVIKLHISTLFDFTAYDVGAGLPMLGVAFYSLLRNGRLKTLISPKTPFFLFWMVPSLLFYLLVFIHRANPGYALIFLPPLLLVTAASTEYLNIELKKLIARAPRFAIATGVIALNLTLFFFSPYPVTLREIRTHDRILSDVISNVRRFHPDETAIFTGPYIYYGYRQLMYYLPDYHVYQVDVKRNQKGEIRKTFWGIHGETHLSERVLLPEEIQSFASLLVPEDIKRIEGVSRLKIALIDNFITIVSGPANLIGRIYPDLPTQGN